MCGFITCKYLWRGDLNRRGGSEKEEKKTRVFSRRTDEHSGGKREEGSHETFLQKKKGPLIPLVHGPEDASFCQTEGEIGGRSDHRGNIGEVETKKWGAAEKTEGRTTFTR